MDVESLLTQLQRVSSVNGGWQAHCPAHDDRKPSLSISLGEDGRILLCCHAGCETADVLWSVGLAMEDLFPSRNGNGKSRGKIVATYDYHNAQGHSLFQVARFEPKDFRQRRPDF